MRPFFSRKSVVNNPVKRIQFAACLAGALLMGGCSLAPSPGKQAARANKAAPNEPRAEKLKTLDEVVAKLPHFDVSGRVVDGDGKPIPGADVWLYFSSGRDGVRDRVAGRTKTDAQGAYRFKKALVWEPVHQEHDYQQKPEYAVIAKHPNHGIYFKALLEGDKTEGVEVVLRGLEVYKPKKAKTDIVEVTDVNGKPVVGARVFLNSMMLAKEDQDQASNDHRYVNLHQDIGVYSTVTDENGQFRKVWVPSQGYTVIKDGYARGDAGNKCVLYPAAQLAGKVTYADGSPAAGAAVFFTYEGERMMATDATETDKQGNYSFAHLPGSGYAFSSMKEDSQKNAKGMALLKAEDLRPGTPFLGKKISFPINPGDRITKDLPLERGCVLSGRIVTVDTGQPVPKIRFSCWKDIPGTNYVDSQSLETDANGQFRTVVAPGSTAHFQWEDAREKGGYIIDQEWQRQAGNYQPHEQMTITKDVTNLLFKVKLWPVTTLTGTVVGDDANATQTATVYMLDRLPGVKTDKAGAFTLKTAPTDRDFDLFAISGNGKRAGIAHLKAGATQAVIPLEPTRDYEGQVMTPDGLPATNLKFSFQISVNRTTIYRTQVQLTTDKEGRFTAKNVYPKGTYSVFWSSDNENNRDYDYGNAEIDVSKLKEGEPITFRAKQFLNALMGRVVNEKDEPIAGAQIGVTSEEALPQNARNVQITSGKDGRFIVERLAGGDVTLTIAAPGYKARSFTTSSDNVDFKAVMKAFHPGDSYTVNATVKDEQGRPVAGAPLTFFVIIYAQAIPTTQVLTATTGADGRASFSYKSPESAGTRVDGRGFVECDMKGFNIMYGSVGVCQDADIAMTLTRSDEHPKGRIVDSEGKPLANAKARVTAMRPGTTTDFRAHVILSEWREIPIPLDKERRFELTRFNPKDWINIDVSAPGYATEHAYFEGKEAGKEKTFTLSPGTAIKGKVVVEGAGAPGARTIVIANTQLGGGRSGQAKPDGSFEMTGLKSGQYDISAHVATTEGAKLVCRPCSVNAEAGKTAEVTVILKPGILVKGRLIDPATKAAPKDNANVMAASSSGRQAGRAAVKKDGAWEMYLPEGEFKLSYYVDGTNRYSESGKTITVVKGKPMEEIVIEVKANSGP